MTAYQVTAKRWDRGWELHIKDLGVTQTKSLAAAQRDAADYIELLTGDTDPEITLIPALGGALERSVHTARNAVSRLAKYQTEAASASRSAVRDLERSGLSGNEIAAVLGISPQRVSQLSAEASGRARKKAPSPAKKAALPAAVRKRSASVSRSKVSAAAVTRSTANSKAKSPSPRKPSSAGKVATSTSSGGTSRSHERR